MGSQYWREEIPMEIKHDLVKFADKGSDSSLSELV